MAPDNNHAVLGGKDGRIQVLNLVAGEIVYEKELAHDGSVWSVCEVSDNSGFISGGADKKMRFWEWIIMEKQNYNDP